MGMAMLGITHKMCLVQNSQTLSSEHSLYLELCPGELCHEGFQVGHNFPSFCYIFGLLLPFCYYFFKGSIFLKNRHFLSKKGL